LDVKRFLRSGVVALAFVAGTAAVMATSAITKADDTAAVTTDQTTPRERATGATESAQPTATAQPAPRVLLIGDSIMDQEGNHAAVALRELGIDARVSAVWGSGLLTRAQYDFGHTIPEPTTPDDLHWVTRARGLVAFFDPDLVVVSMNHNFWPPYPRDASGRVIESVDTPAGQEMVRTQVTALLDAVRSQGADVMFVAPVPGAGEADPLVANPIWRAYSSVLAAQQIPVADITPALIDPEGRRTETKVSCLGSEERVRPEDDVHLTRFGAGRAGTLLAHAVAAHLDRDLGSQVAPGDHTVALVPTATGEGYWIVGCDGGVYGFGDAPALAPVSRAASAPPIVGAARARRDGLWLVAADGSVLPLGGVDALQLRPRPAEPIVAVAGTADGRGIVAVTATGTVHVAGSARAFGARVPSGSAPVVDVAVRPQGDGYWIARADGTVLGVGDARVLGSDAVLTSPYDVITGIASSPSGNGYWLAHGAGTVTGYGDAAVTGDAVRNLDSMPPDVAAVYASMPYPPVVAIVAQPSGDGQWIVQDNGKVTAVGGALDAGGTGFLALFTD
jgi:hypothetical protein